MVKVCFVSQEILRSKGLKLGYCTMPKMGSTFWRKAWGPLQKAFNDQGKADADPKSTVKVKRFIYLYSTTTIMTQPYRL